MVSSLTCVAPRLTLESVCLHETLFQPHPQTHTPSKVRRRYGYRCLLFRAAQVAPFYGPGSQEQLLTRW